MSKARVIVLIFIAMVFAGTGAAWLMADPAGYGGSSEAKMNFLRALVFVVSAIQIAMGITISKVMQAMPGVNEKKLLTTALVSGILCALPAVFGLFLVAMTRAFNDYLICGAIALVGFMLIFPRGKPITSK